MLIWPLHSTCTHAHPGINSAAVRTCLATTRSTVSDFWNLVDNAQFRVRRWPAGLGSCGLLHPPGAASACCVPGAGSQHPLAHGSVPQQVGCCSLPCPAPSGVRTLGIAGPLPCRWSKPSTCCIKWRTRRLHWPARPTPWPPTRRVRASATCPGRSWAFRVLVLANRGSMLGPVQWVPSRYPWLGVVGQQSTGPSAVPASPNPMQWWTRH